MMSIFKMYFRNMSTCFALLLGLTAAVQAQNTSEPPQPSPVPQDTASPQTITSSEDSREKTFGAWTLRCEMPPGAMAQQCRIEQFVVDEQRPNVSLMVMLFKTADGKNWFMRIITPLGIMLPKGMQIAIDQKFVPGTLPYVRCFAGGCFVDLVDNNVIEALRTADSLTMVVWLGNEDGLGIPISLDGFKQAFEAIQ